MSRSRHTARQGRARGHWARRLLKIGVAVLLAALLLPVGMGFLLMGGVTHPLCSPGPSPDRFGLVAEDVLVPARTGVSYRGYFIEGTNGATIIVPPALGQDRGGWLHEAAVLARNGYSVLTYDSRQCSGLATHSLGPREAEDVLDAVDYLRSRGDVDVSRIGAHGFSQAGATNLFAAAQTDVIRAVVAEGGYVDYWEQTLGPASSRDLFTRLFAFGSQTGYRVMTGLDAGALRLIDLIPALAPRRVLLVYGSFEVTLGGARQAADLAEHVQLWEVPGATHGSYLATAGEAEFTRQVVGFFDEALAPPAE